MIRQAGAGSEEMAEELARRPSVGTATRPSVATHSGAVWRPIVSPITPGEPLRRRKTMIPPSLPRETLILRRLT